MKIIKNPNITPELIKLCLEMHKESRFENVPINMVKVERFLNGLIRNSKSAVFQLNSNGVPIGFLFASITSHFFSNEEFACDRSFFIIKSERGVKAMNTLFDEYVKWAETFNVREIVIGSIVGYKTDKIEILFRRKGFRKTGIQYVK